MVTYVNLWRPALKRSMYFAKFIRECIGFGTTAENVTTMQKITIGNHQKTYFKALE